MLLRATAWLWIVNPGLRFVAYADLRRRLRLDERQAPGRGVEVGDVERGRRMQYLVAAASHLCPWKSRCLARSIVLNVILAGEGIPSRICFGVSVEPGDFEAHAWVEIDGEPVGESVENREKYAPFDSESEMGGVDGST